jgi:RHS repeat-associated protein
MKSQQYNGVTAANFYYNARNLLMKKEYPGTTGNVVTYEYYADGQLSKKTDRNNIKTQYIYNPQGLVLEEKATLFTVNNSGQEVEQSHTMKSFVYDDAGNQLESSITSSTLTTNETVERTYDELGRVKTKSVSNIEGKVKYVYDIITSDGLTAETSVDQKNNVTTKVYDKAGRIAFVKNGNIEAENAAEYRYYKNGAAQSIIYANGAREDYTYFDDELLKTLDNKKPDGTLIESYSYTYDANYNMHTKEDNKGTTSYTYDDLNRLKEVDEKYSGKITEYAYDGFGNRTSATINQNGIMKEEIYDYNYYSNLLEKVTFKTGSTVDEVISYGYDGNGNLISSETKKNGTITNSVTYGYDEFNQLISTGDFNYGYNAEGYRISKSSNGSLTRYLYEYDKVVLEVETKAGQQDKVNRNIYGTNLLMRTADGQSYYYMYNGHADVTALINVATGSVDATYYYDAFGNIDPTGTTGDVNNNITYGGYQYDEETGLYYLNARMYDPKIARFLQEDTYAGNPNDPLSLNLYTYCANNPVLCFLRGNNKNMVNSNKSV